MRYIDSFSYLPTKEANGRFIRTSRIYPLRLSRPFQGRIVPPAFSQDPSTHLNGQYSLPNSSFHLHRIDAPTRAAISGKAALSTMHSGPAEARDHRPRLGDPSLLFQLPAFSAAVASSTPRRASTIPGGRTRAARNPHSRTRASRTSHTRALPPRLPLVLRPAQARPVRRGARGSARVPGVQPRRRALRRARRVRRSRRRVHGRCRGAGRGLGRGRVGAGGGAGGR